MMSSLNLHIGLILDTHTYNTCYLSLFIAQASIKFLKLNHVPASESQEAETNGILCIMWLDLVG